MIAILHALGMLVADLLKARARAQNPEDSVPRARVIDALNPARFVRPCVPETLSLDDLRFDRENFSPFRKSHPPEIRMPRQNRRIMNSDGCRSARCRNRRGQLVQVAPVT